MPSPPPRPARSAARRLVVLALGCLLAAPAAGGEEVAWRARLVDGTGAPVAGARVTLHPVETAAERGRRLLAGDAAEVLAADTAGADGRVAITRPSDVPNLLRVRAAGHADTWIRLYPGPAWSGVDGEMVLIADPGLEVRVLDPAGEPVAGARVHLFGLNPFGPSTGALATSGDDGRARLPKIFRPGIPGRRDAALPVAVRVLPPTGRADLAPAPELHVEDGVAAVSVTLQAARPRTLVLRAADGTPAAGVLVALASESLPAPGPPLVAGDAAGRVRVPEPLGEEPLALHLVAADGSWQRLELPASRQSGVAAAAEAEAVDGGAGDDATPPPGEPAPPLEVTLRPPTPVHLRLLTAADGSPLAGGTVILLPDRVARSGADGRIALHVPDDLGDDHRHAVALVFAAGHEYANVDLGAIGLGSAAEPIPLRLQPMAALSGRVTGEDGAGIAAAWVGVTAIPDGGARAGLPWPAQYGHVTSGIGGAFSIADLPPDRALRLRVEAAGHVPAERSLPTLERGESRSGLVVELAPGHRATAVVLATDGRPVPGARLDLTPHATGGGDRSGQQPVTCDRQGTCRVDGLSAGAFDLEAAAPGHAPTVVRGVEIPDVPPGVPVDLGTLYLEPAVALAGRVSDAGGSPLAGAEVWAEPVSEIGWPGARDPGLPRTVSGDDGSFRLDGLAAGQRVHLVADAPGYAAALLPTVEAPRDDLELRLDEAAVVAGVVVDDAGRPVAGVQVRGRPVPWQQLDRHLPDRPEAGSDEDGRFELAELPAGTLEITAHGEAHAGGLEVELAAGEERLDLRLELRRKSPPMRLRGRVVDESGRPVAGADVEVDVKFAPGGGSSSSTRTGADGTFDLSADLAARAGHRQQLLRVALEVDHADYSRHRRELPLPAAAAAGAELEPQEIVLRQGGTEVAGVVVGADGTPLEGARVVLETPAFGLGQHGRADSRQVIAGPDGAFRFTGVDAAAWRLSASHPEWVDGGLEEPLEIADSPVEGLRVVLDRGAVLVARVSGLDDRGLTGVRVQAVLHRGDHHYDSLSGRPDYRGEARLPGAAGGLWRVTAHTGDGLREARASVEVGRGDREVPVELDFARGSTVSGVLVTNGEPRAGVLLRLNGEGGSQRAVTDADGRFRFEGVPDGDYSVGSFQAAVSREITVRGDTEVRLEVESTLVSLHVVDPEGNPLVAEVEFRRLDSDDGRGGRFSGSSDIRIELPPGTYGFTVRVAGYVPADVQVEAGSGADDDLRVVLEPGDAAWLDLGAGAQPPPGQVLVQVTAGPTLADTAHWYGVGSDGRVRIDGLLPGRSELRVSAPGRAPVHVAVEVPGPPVPVGLPPAASLQVTVPALAHAEHGGSLRILDSTGRPLSALGSFGRFEDRWGLAAGSTRVEGLPAGTWTVVVSSPGAADRRAAVTLAAGATTAVVLE